MRNLYGKGKIIAIWLCQNLLHIFFVFPLRKKRIIFSSYSGRQYSCNPKYITEYLLKEYPRDFEIIWAFRFPQNFTDIDKKIKRVKYKSLKYLYYLLTSHIVIDNVESWSILPKRDGQIVINTWHGGGAYKGVGLKRKDASTSKMKIMLNRNKRISLYISSSHAFTTMTLRNSFNYSGNVLECGMPRNDILLAKTDIKLADKIKRKLKLKQNTKVVLYAPTFRAEHGVNVDLNIVELLNALEKKFSGAWCVLFRTHYYIEDDYKNLEDAVIDVSNYPDMQELLLISDILVTDYSSCMWDFSLMYKPCFLFMTDLERYNNEREFYTPIETWPFPIARTNSDLEANISEFILEDYIKRVKQHHKELGICETGHASETIGELIYQYSNNIHIEVKYDR